MSVHLLINRLGGQWWSTFQYKIAWHSLAHILAVFQRISHGKTKSLTLMYWGKLAALKHPVTSPPLSLAGSCALNEGLLYTKGCHAWQAGHRTPPSRLPTTTCTLEGRLQAGPETHRHWSGQLQTAGRWPHQLAPRHPRRGQEGQRNALPTAGGQKTTHKADTANSSPWTTL